MSGEYPNSIEGMREHGKDMTEARKEKDEQKRKKRNKLLAHLGLAAATVGTAFAVKGNKATETKASLDNERKTQEKSAPAVPGKEVSEAMQQRDLRDSAEDTDNRKSEEEGKIEKEKYQEIIKGE